MTSFQKYIIALIKSALFNQNGAVEEIGGWDEIWDLAYKHQIASIIYYGVVNSKADIPEEYYKKLQDYTFKNLFVDRKQTYTIKCLEKEFRHYKIDYMLLKGSVLKQIYPKTDMRTMSDIDILIHSNQYDTISEIMKRLGFSFKAQSSHDYEWTSKMIHIELHKSMIPPQDADYYEYFGNGWYKALKCPDSPYAYRLSNEDQLIYVFTHFAKHYRNGGIGIRHMIDLWIILDKYPQINLNYVSKALKSIGLLDFFKNVMYVLQVWFENKPSTDKSDYITEYIFESGAYGISKNRMISTCAKKYDGGSTFKMRIKYIISQLFPKIDSMKLAYPVLKNAPILLPLVWIYRFFKVLIFKRGRMSNSIKKISNMNADDAKERQKALKYVGLKYFN